MITDKILKQLTPERVKKEVKAVQKVKLPPELQKWVKEYEKVGKRSKLFWQFMFKGNKMFSFLRASQKYKIAELKFIVTMFIVLFDDVADQAEDLKLLDKMLKIPHDNKKDGTCQGLSKKQKVYLNFTTKIWRHINWKIKKLPSFSNFKNIFRYDIQQTLNAIKYAYLINKDPYFINKTEYWLYSPHTLQGMVNCSLDFMCFSKIDLREIGKTREIFWNAQKMGRISNCLSTWKNEFKEQDLTSATLAYAMNYNLISINDLYKENKIKIINKIDNSFVKKELLKEWENCYKEIYSLCNQIKLIKSNIILKQLENFLIIYLSAGKSYEHRYNV